MNCCCRLTTVKVFLFLSFLFIPLTAFSSPIDSDSASELAVCGDINGDGLVATRADRRDYYLAMDFRNVKAFPENCDLNADKVCDRKDLTLLRRAAYGKGTLDTCGAPADVEGDTTGNGLANEGDFRHLINCFGKDTNRYGCDRYDHMIHESCKRVPRALVREIQECLSEDIDILDCFTPYAKRVGTGPAVCAEGFEYANACIAYLAGEDESQLAKGSCDEYSEEDSEGDYDDESDEDDDSSEEDDDSSEDDDSLSKTVDESVELHKKHFKELPTPNDVSELVHETTPTPADLLKPPHEQIKDSFNAQKKVFKFGFDTSKKAFKFGVDTHKKAFEFGVNTHNKVTDKAKKALDKLPTPPTPPGLEGVVPKPSDLLKPPHEVIKDSVKNHKKLFFDSHKKAFKFGYNTHNKVVDKSKEVLDKIPTPSALDGYAPKPSDLLKPPHEQIKDSFTYQKNLFKKGLDVQDKVHDNAKKLDKYAPEVPAPPGLEGLVPTKPSDLLKPPHKVAEDVFKKTTIDPIKKVGKTVKKIWKKIF